MISAALGVPLTLLSSVGLLLNGYILVVVVLTRQLATANNLLLMHLGLVDALLGVLFLIFTLPSFAARATWVSSGAPCMLHGFLFTLLHPVALWTVCGLNCDRYYAISAPLHYGALVSPKKVAIGLGLAWFIALLLSIPPFFMVAPYQYSTYLGACAPDFTIGDGVFWYSILYTALTLLLPAVLILGCNIKVLMIARYHRHRIASAIYEVTLSAQVTITHQRNPFFVPTVTAPSHGGPKFRGRSAVPTVLQLLGSFLVLYFPYYTVILWNSASASSFFDNVPKVHPHLIIIATVLLTCSPPVNGLLYGVKNKTLRKTFQNYWRKQMSKSEVNHEIQARTPSTCGSRRPSLTPLGLLSKPMLQRRLSEAQIDVNKSGSPQHPKIKRIASELSWRPGSTNGLQNYPNENPRRTIKHTSSCNTLQVPNREVDDGPNIAEDVKMSFKELKRGSKDVRSRVSTANILLQKVFGVDAPEASPSNVHLTTHVQTVLETKPTRKSPRILITRAFSEESDKSPSVTGSPARTAAMMNRKHSISTTTLLERKWRTLKSQTTDDESDSDSVNKKTVSTCMPSSGERHSDSSSASETSSGKMYTSLDDRSCFPMNQDSAADSDTPAAADEPLLLSWPPTNKQRYRKSPPKSLYIRQKTILDDTVGRELAL